MAFGLLFGLVGLVCAVWIIYDVFTNQRKMGDREKLLWIVLAIVFSVITAIFYYFLVKKK
ncbi:hypothetical protein A3K63_02390 [Candidatus Micrarchaeota archaeon RBG_16_49_10]|nr:MAG: hypothetical protein A3K63_02390 [Candidatus Micrarchaeota archaeon RBG_16_49_10]